MSKINYDLSKIRAIVFDVDGVLSPTTVPMNEKGVPQRMANLKDGYAMKIALESGMELCIITGAETEAVARRFEAIGMSDIFQGALEKLPTLKKWMADKGLRPDEVAYCGDDIPDMAPMRYVGLSVAPSDAAVDVKRIARYITSASGGYGVARELIEEIMKSKRRWPADSVAFGG